MYFWIVNCSLAFLLCVLCASIVIPQILLIAFRKKLFDFPDERKVHHCAVPRLGGIAFKPVVFFTIALLLGINMVLGHSEILSEIGNDVCSLAFVFPSYREGFPNVVMQAGALELPQIVTDINGCNEIIVQNKNGIIVPPQDEHALYKAMKYFWIILMR